MWKWEAEEPRGVVVIVHGSGEHHGRYEWLIDKWCTNGFHVIAGDLPGQGQTTRRRGHIDSFDEYIEAVASWVEEAEAYELPIFLLAHSLGGLVAIRTMTEKNLPLNAVILSSPCLGLVKSPPRSLRLAVKAANRLSPKFRVKIKSTSENPNATRNRERLKLDAKDPLIVTKVSVRWYNELEKAMKLATEKEDDLPDIPLLVMQAGDDKIVDKESVNRWFNRNANKERSYKEWNGLYHEIFNEPEREDVFHYALGFIELRLDSRKGL